jgi:hypothetical protein
LHQICHASTRRPRRPKNAKKPDPDQLKCGISRRHLDGVIARCRFCDRTDGGIEWSLWGSIQKAAAPSKTQPNTALFRRFAVRTLTFPHGTAFAILLATPLPSLLAADIST